MQTTSIDDQGINTKVEDRLMSGEYGPYNVSDYMEFPEDGPRYQLMRGWFVREPAPSEKHQTVVGNLYVLLRRWVDRRKIGRVYISPFDAVLSPSDVVQPDLLFISKARLGLINPKNLEGGPDLVVEVLSPSTRKRDVTVKVELFREAGVVEAWIVDPDTEHVEIIDLQRADRAAQRYSGSDYIQSHVFGLMDFTVADAFFRVV